MKQRECSAKRYAAFAIHVALYATKCLWRVEAVAALFEGTRICRFRGSARESPIRQTEVLVRGELIVGAQGRA